MRLFTKRAIIFSFLVLPIVLAFVYLILFSVLPYNPLSYEETLSKKIQVIIPESWNFFTKNPREPYTYVFQKKGEQWLRFEYFPNSNPDNFFGIIRKSRAQSLAMGILISEIPGSLWDSTSVSKSFFEEINKNTTCYKIENKTKEKMLCGEVCIVQSLPLPWSWRHTNSQLKMPTRFIKLLIECK